MTMIKICGLTNRDDAYWAWRSGADLLGYIFVKASPRYVQPNRAARIIRTLREQGCSLPMVGVCADSPLEDIREIINLCGLDHVQLHGHEPSDYLKVLNVPTIRAVHVDDGFTWEALPQDGAWAYLLDSYSGERLGGTGQSWDWRRAQGGEKRVKRLIVAGGLTPDNVVHAIRALRPWGVDVASGVELAPGQKDPSRVHKFIRNVRSIDDLLLNKENE